MGETLRVLGIFPHPDDESYSCAGTFAGLAEQGAEIHLVSATAGESGQDLRDVYDDGRTLGEVRAEELARSCAVVGIRAPAFLGLRDGGLCDVDFPQVVGRLVAIIRSVRPHVVVSLGEDGVYGHPDHLALYRLIVAAYHSAAGGERFPASEHGSEWQPQRLYCAAFPRGMFRPMYDHMLSSEYVSSIRQVDPDKLGVEPPDVGVAVDIRPYADKKLAAIASHVSQLRAGDPVTLFPNELVRRTLTTELFTLGAGKPLPRRLRQLSEDLDL
jgi:N-acetyl-1-D-myo-inositol-2-amino-2-deoxy-alpha-D-glucopyranoside deacetylase